MCAAGQIAHDQRSDKASQVSHRIDQAYGSSGSGLAQEKSGDRPETRLKPIKRPARKNEQGNRRRQVEAIDNSQSQGYATQKKRNGRVPSALASSIGMPSIHLLCNKRGNILQASQQGYSEAALSGQTLQDGPYPKRDAVAPRHRAEIAQR